MGARLGASPSVLAIAGFTAEDYTTLVGIVRPATGEGFNLKQPLPPHVRPAFDMLFVAWAARDASAAPPGAILGPLATSSLACSCLPSRT